MKTFLIAAALSVAAFGASAAEVTYTIDKGHTHPSFEINHLGFSTYRGRFDAVSGSVVLDLDKKTARADISLDVGFISTGVAKLDEHLKTAEFFDVEKFPVITFKSTKSKFKGDKLIWLNGDLTMHGVTKPVTLNVTSFVCKDHPMKKVPACGADASAIIKRSDWGITTYVPAVGDEVKLEIEVEAQAEAPAAAAPATPAK